MDKPNPLSAKQLCELAWHVACDSRKHFEACQFAVTRAGQPQVCERKVSQHGSLTGLLITWVVTMQSCTQNQVSMSHIADSSSALLPSISHSSFEPPLHSPLLRVRTMPGMQHVFKSMLQLNIQPAWMCMPIVQLAGSRF